MLNCVAVTSLDICHDHRWQRIPNYWTSSG